MKKEKLKMKEYAHLMLDIETMGNESYSAILSIGALEFDINTGKTGRDFLVDIDLQSCLDIGLIMNASTVLWWMQQNEQARKDITSENRVRITKALIMFSEFCDRGYKIWGNSARFDCGILENAYDKAEMPIPWDFRKERCVRTLSSFCPEIKENYPKTGTEHNALDDCYFQVGYCSAIWNKLKK